MKKLVVFCTLSLVASDKPLRRECMYQGHMIPCLDVGKPIDGTPACVALRKKLSDYQDKVRMGGERGINPRSLDEPDPCRPDPKKKPATNTGRGIEGD